ncbi:MAG: hypothetical protein VB112_09430 [Oscillospiraceae bacterium]|nr:hypothetical protein [Oscillospiraceae bacterium]
MKVLILNGSPKRKGSASGFLAAVARPMLSGCRVVSSPLHGKGDYANARKQLSDIDAVLLCVPLYVDGIPSHVQEFLEETEQYCRNRNLRFRLYVISNNGFIEGRQNAIHLKMYQCWCEHAGVIWGGGIGIGGGMMLHALSMVYPFVFLGFALCALYSFIHTGTAPTGLLRSFAENLLIYLFLNSGMLVLIARLASNIKKGATAADRFTRVMLPSFLFLVFADVFMILSALFHGRLLFPLLKKDSADDSMLHSVVQ